MSDDAVSFAAVPAAAGSVPEASGVPGAPRWQPVDGSGETFLRLLVRDVSTLLGMAHVFVAEFQRGHVRMLAFWSDGAWRDTLEYDLHGTPCEDVIRGGTWRCDDDVQTRYPEDVALGELGARSYVGVSLVSGAAVPIGHLAALGRDPLPETVDPLPVLQGFAERARVELERMRAEHLLRDTLQSLHGEIQDRSAALERSNQELAYARDELAALLRINQAVSRHLDRDELFGALAAHLSGLLTADRFGIELPLGSDRLRGHLLTPIDGRLAGPTEPHVMPAEGTVCDWVLRQGDWWLTGAREELRTRFPSTFEIMTREGMESLCVLPLRSGGTCRAALFVMAAAADAYQGVRKGLLEELAEAVAVALDHCLAHEELRRLRDQLAAENLYLQQEIQHQHNFDEIVGQSGPVRQMLRQIALVAPTDSTVLIQGETGTGKELVARAIHARSPRSERPLIKLNCAAIPDGLVESELFGHEKGAFTGATQRRTGRFELADGGSLFLDEVGELPLPAQAKLLRVLQEREFERVGGSRPIRTDVRVIAATNRDLAAEVAAGRFREDLYYRLSVFPVRVPPLRERADDVPLLAQYFVDRHAPRIGRKARRVAEPALLRLEAHDWRGNVRELENVVERSLILCDAAASEVGEDVIQAVLGMTDPRSAAAPATAAQALTLDDLERLHIQQTLDAAGGRIEGDGGAARRLGLAPSTLRSLMKRLDIERPGR